MPKFFKTFIAFLFAIASVSFAILVFSGGAIFWNHRFGGMNDNLLKNEMAFYPSQGFQVGQYLQRIDPNKQLLLVMDPDFHRNDNIKQLAYAMIEGYGSNDIQLDTVQLPEQFAEMPMPLYMTMTTEDFDKVIDKYPDAAVVISTIGLPTELDNLKVLRYENGPKILLMGLPGGPIPELPELIRNDKICGVVLSNPQARYDIPAPKNRNEAFAIRYVLITKENLDEYSNLFGM